MTFETEAELAISIPDRELRNARNDIEESLGSVSVTVDGKAAATDGGGVMAGGAVVGDELRDQTSLLEDIHDELEKIGASGGLGGSGGGGGGLFGGLSGFGLGSLAAGGGGLLGTILAKGSGTLGKAKNVPKWLRGASNMGRFGRLKGMGSWVGRSPFTMLSQSQGAMSGENLKAPGDSGPQDLFQGNFTLSEDFWPGKPDIFNDIINGEFTLQEGFWPDEPQVFRDIQSGNFTLKEEFWPDEPQTLKDIRSGSFTLTESFWPSKPGWVSEAMSALTNDPNAETIDTKKLDPLTGTIPGIDFIKDKLQLDDGSTIDVSKPDRPDYSNRTPDGFESWSASKKASWFQNNPSAVDNMGVSNSDSPTATSNGNRAKENGNRRTNVTVNNDVTVDGVSDRDLEAMVESLKRDIKNEVAQEMAGHQTI